MRIVLRAVDVVSVVTPLSVDLFISQKHGLTFQVSCLNMIFQISLLSDKVHDSSIKLLHPPFTRCVTLCFSGKRSELRVWTQPCRWPAQGQPYMPLDEDVFVGGGVGGLTAAEEEEEDVGMTGDPGNVLHICTQHIPVFTLSQVCIDGTARPVSLYLVKCVLMAQQGLCLYTKSSVYRWHSKACVFTLSQVCMNGTARPVSLGLVKCVLMAQQGLCFALSQVCIDGTARPGYLPFHCDKHKNSAAALSL
jgi:hypothetical protein